jgi:hypothetical protein
MPIEKSNNKVLLVSFIAAFISYTIQRAVENSPGARDPEGIQAGLIFMFIVTLIALAYLYLKSKNEKRNLQTHQFPIRHIVWRPWAHYASLKSGYLYNNIRSCLIFFCAIKYQSLWRLQTIPRLILSIIIFFDSTIKRRSTHI